MFYFTLLEGEQCYYRDQWCFPGFADWVDEEEAAQSEIYADFHQKDLV